MPAKACHGAAASPTQPSSATRCLLEDRPELRRPTKSQSEPKQPTASACIDAAKCCTLACQLALPCPDQDAPHSPAHSVHGLGGSHPAFCWAGGGVCCCGIRMDYEYPYARRIIIHGTFGVEREGGNMGNKPSVQPGAQPHCRQEGVHRLVAPGVQWYRLVHTRHGVQGPRSPDSRSN